jgi:hypothetical protein
LDEHNRQFHPEDDIPTSLKCEVLDEHHDDDDAGAKSCWRFHWKSLIGKQNRREEKYVIVDAHLREDRTLVCYAWMVCPDEKEEGEFRCKQKVKN